jgi:hypothetical protein
VCAGLELGTEEQEFAAINCCSEAWPAVWLCVPAEGYLCIEELTDKMVVGKQGSLQLA